MKPLFIIIALLCTAAQAEGFYWELTVVKDTELIDTPVHFGTKHTCVQVGIAYMRADDSLNGFICEREKAT